MLSLSLRLLLNMLSLRLLLGMLAMSVLAELPLLLHENAQLLLFLYDLVLQGIRPALRPNQRLRLLTTSRSCLRRALLRCRGGGDLLHRREAPRPANEALRPCRGANCTAWRLDAAAQDQREEDEGAEEHRTTQHDRIAWSSRTLPAWRCPSGAPLGLKVLEVLQGRRRGEASGSAEHWHRVRRVQARRHQRRCFNQVKKTEAGGLRAPLI
mmetsp:Transcript_110786/g.278500  ORF Transcript_110786/g.278500 Transcript_110786/m.278500 type:complete len:211 (+) Transcript_110786:554-1186(+)